MRRTTRIAVAAFAAIAASGCFVGDEIDNASNMLGKDKSHQTPPPATGVAKAPGDKGEKGDAKQGTAVASAGDAAKSVVATGKAWWATAKTLGSEESNPEIAGCQLKGKTEFMLRDDCLARGGVPSS